jgi:hypothetical protein
VVSADLAAKEKREQQAEMIRRFQPSPVSAILMRGMEQLPQPEIVMVKSESDAPSPDISSEDPDSDIPVPEIVTVPSFLFRDHIVRRPEPFPEWATKVDTHMFGIEGKRAISWEQFKDLIADSGEMSYGAVEQKRYEKCTVPPCPDNAVIVASVLAIWRDSLIPTLKVVRKGDWPIALFGYAMSGFFKAIPFRSQVTVLVESSDILSAVVLCSGMEAMGQEPHEYTTMPQSLEMAKMRKNKGLVVHCRAFDGDLDAPIVTMRMIAIRQAQETMERGVSERDNPFTFLA